MRTSDFHRTIFATCTQRKDEWDEIVQELTAKFIEENDE